MTKIKNTKKGMAKKTLSISLAVAMLATSNVPVWAAEDLFTDGEVAVEAFTAEEEVVEAPVVEEPEEVVDVQAVDSNYTVDFKDFKKEFQWGTGRNNVVKVKVVDSVTGDKVTSDMKFRFVDANGNEVEKYGPAQPFRNVDKDGYASVELNFDIYHVGQTFRMQVFKDLNEDWITTSPEMTVAKREIFGEVTYANPVTYTGKQIENLPVGAQQVVWNDGKEDPVDWEGFEIQNFTGVSGDTINSKNYSNDVVKAEGNILSPYYTGKVTGTFEIGRKSVATADEAVTVTLPSYTFEYTGFDRNLLGHSFTVTNKLSGEVVNGAAQKYLLTKEIGEKTPSVYVNMDTDTLKNFDLTGKDGTNPVVPATLPVKPEVVKRDLTNTEKTIISIKTVTQETLQESVIDANALKAHNLVIRDANGDKIDTTDITVSFGGKDSLAVEAGKTYTATIKGDADKFVGERTVEFNVVAHNLNDAEFAKEAAFLKEHSTQAYTGKQITFGLTAANLTEKLGDLYVEETVLDENGDPVLDKNGNLVQVRKALSKETDYDANVLFGENTNVGEGKIIINGKGGYAGSQKVISFIITPRTVTINNVNVPEKVLYNEDYREASEYGIIPTIVVKGKDELNNDIELTVPASEYKVDYVFEVSNEVDDEVATIISNLSSKNFVANYSHDYEGLKNRFIKYTRIANKEITADDIQMEKTEYTYTGKAIVPEYKVVVDGVTLEKGVDYTEQIIHNKNVGEATLTITGRGNYDRTSVSKKFTVVAANISDLKVESKAVYDGRKHDDISDLVVYLGDVNVTSEVKALFPTSKLANINAGDATVTLKADEKISKNFVGEHEFTFTIAPYTFTKEDYEKIAAEKRISAFDAKGSKINFSKVRYDYDGTAHTFASTVFDTKGIVEKPMVFTENDYEIVYKDNVVGKRIDRNDGLGQIDYCAAILVVAKGNYAGAEANDYTCADGTVVKNVIAKQEFTVNPHNIEKAEVTVENGAYAEGNNVDPVVTVTYKGKELVKGIDYELDYSAYTQDRTEVTNGKTLKVRIKGIGGYIGYVDNKYPENWDFTWGIDKFDLENAEVVVSGTDADPIVKVINAGKVVSEADYDLAVAEGKATITAKETSKHYVGTKTVEIKEALEKPVAPMIERVDVTGNKATVVLSGESEGAIGYDYVIATGRDCIDTKVYDKVNKNKLTTDTTFQYVEQGMYYAYCHAWTRDENGKKVFSDWSNAYPFSVSAITPSQPTITSVTQKGSTVTVTYTESKDAIGYDVVLGSAMATVNNERRPVDYGTLVERNAKTTTVTFKDVPAGTYYVGLHSYNRTSEDGKKVFSPWSVAKTFKVK